MNSAKSKKKVISIERLPSTDSSIVEIPETSEEPERSRTVSSSSSSSSDDEYDGMTAAEIMAKIKPPSAIPKSRGIPLYHVFNITKENLKIIRESGIFLDKDILTFTKEEDGLIRRNWAELARIQKFNGHIFDYLGYDKDGLVQKSDPNVMSAHVRRKVLWPTLCKGLEKRCAKTVNMRISLIFHPFFDEEEYQNYDLDEIDERFDNNETVLEVSEAMKIPPRFLERKFVIRPKKVLEMCLPRNQKIIVLKLLHDCVIENAGDKFLVGNFNWIQFKNRCLEHAIDPPPAIRTVNETFRTKFFHYERTIFKVLNPHPTLKKKLNYMHEAMQRYLLKERYNMKKAEYPRLCPHIFLTVVLEDYSKNSDWAPPPVLEMLAKSRKINLEKIRSRVQVIKEQRKRMNEASSPKAKFHVVVKKRITMEDLQGQPPAISREEERMEISSIHEQSSVSSFSIAPSVDPFASSEDDPLTELELSSINNTSSFIGSRNETILAAGGGGPPADNTTLGSLNQSLAGPKEDEAVSLDMSQNIWSQLVGN